MDLSDFFVTKSQATDFSVRLSTIIDQMYTTHFSLEQALADQFSVIKVDTFLKLMRENAINTGSLPDVQNFLKKIQENLSNLPVVSLTIAFEPSQAVLQNLSQWFVTSINKQVLFDIVVDPSVIAGAKITYNGKFKDYSLGPVFTNFLSQMMQTSQVMHSDGIKKATVHQRTQDIEIGR